MGRAYSLDLSITHTFHKFGIYYIEQFKNIKTLAPKVLHVSTHVVFPTVPTKFDKETKAQLVI